MSKSAISGERTLSSYVLWRVLPVVLVFMAAVGFTVLSATEDAVHDTVHERLSHQSDLVADLIDQNLSAIEDQVRLLANNDLIINGLIDLESRELYLPTFFKSLQSGDSDAARVSLIDYRGRELFSNNLEGGPRRVAAEWLQSIEAGEEVRYLGVDGLIMASPVMVYGYPEGALVMSLSSQAVANLVETTPIGLSVLLANDTDTVLHFFGDNESGDRLSVGEQSNWIKFEHSLEFLPDVRVITGQHKDDALRSVYNLRQFLLFATLGSLVAIVVAIIYATYLSRRELDSLGEVVGNITRPGDFQHKIALSDISELRVLGQSFNSMLETLKRTTTSRAYLDNILNSIGELIIVATPSGEILSTNFAAREFMESRKMEPDASIASVIRADAYLQDHDLWNFMRVTTDQNQLEGVYYFPVLSPKALLWFRSSIREEDGSESDSVYVGTDITDRVHMDQLKTEFVSTVSHELRTPLTSILASIRMVRSGVLAKTPGKSEELLDIAAKNSERLVLLINDILDMQKIEAGEMEIELQTMDMGPLLEQAVAANKAYALQYGAHFNVIEPGHGLWVEADPDRLEQVFSNLLSNAAKFSDGDPKVTVEARRDGPEVIVRVQGNGVGIPREKHAVVFERFKQVDASDSRSKGAPASVFPFQRN